MKKTGTRQEVWLGKARATVSGLTKDKLMLNKRNKLVSRARSEASKKNVSRLAPYMFKKKNKDNKNGERSTPIESSNR